SLLALLSLPTRRSSDLLILSIPIQEKPLFGHLSDVFGPTAKGILGDFSKRATETVKVGKDALNKLFKTTPGVSDRLEIKQSARQDRKSTRLNSSHVKIS